MSQKILIADDSLTIQKVIKITLANEPFQIAVCSHANELEQAIINEKPNIVLLDFNLSEDKTGYELSKLIHQTASNIKILMLYGTFDTIDEGMLNEARVSNNIVKPFDGTKFINLCRSMANQSQDSDRPSVDMADDSFFDTTETNKLHEEDDSFEPIIDNDISDDWVMNSPHNENTENENLNDDKINQPTTELEPIEEVKPQGLQASLQKNLAEWGMDVPGVIGPNNQRNMSVPDIISDAMLDQEEVDALTQGSFGPSTDKMSQEEVDAMAGGSFGPSTGKMSQEEVDAMAGASMNRDSSLQQSVIDNLLEDKNDAIMPDSNDLEYPNMNASPSAAPTSSLVPLEDLEPEDGIEVNLDDDSTGEFVIENGDLGVGTSTEEEVEALERQIESEVGEDLWVADAEEEFSTHDSVEIEVSSESVNNLEVRQNESVASELNDDLPMVEPHKLYEVMKESPELSHMVNEEAPSDFPEDVMQDADVPRAKNINSNIEVTEDLKEKLKEQLTPVVQEFVKQYCQENIEKIAWEVIPDLAENLIKKEIQKISSSILNQ